MKQIAFAIALGMAVVAQASAADMSALAKQKNCLACHSVDQQMVGPAYKDVAAKFAGNTKAVTILSNAILHGSSGVWGPMSMPPNVQVTPAQAKELAQWILSLKK